MRDTPCGDVVGKPICLFPQDVRNLFPDDAVLQEMMAEGYAGTTLWSSQGQPIGLIAMISRKPIHSIKRAESLLQLVSMRSAGELERKLAEDSLARTSEQVARILDSISDAFFSLNREWCFTYVNREAQYLLEASGEQLIGINIWDRFPLALGSTFQIEYERAMREGIAIQFESYYPPFDKWFEVRAYPYNDGLSVYFRDCSERRALQEMQAQAFERNAHIVDMLQHIILPPLIPLQTPGYETATNYQASMKEAEVCGDFYDVFDMGNGKIGIVIGDIVGKGLQAAARVVAVRNTIKSYAFIHNHPSTIMTLLSDTLSKSITTESDMFTAFVAVLDTYASTLIYSNGGHEPPLVMHSDGSVEFLHKGGPMFFGMGVCEYSEGMLRLSNGDVLVMVTDGITEARKETGPHQYGMEGIISQLSSIMNDSAETIAAKILENAMLYAGNNQRDDIAMVVIKKLNN